MESSGEAAVDFEIDEGKTYLIRTGALWSRVLVLAVDEHLEYRTISTTGSLPMNQIDEWATDPDGNPETGEFMRDGAR